MNLRCRVPQGAALLLFTEGVDHESIPHRLPGLDRDLGRVVGHSHRDLEPDHLVWATTQTTELLRSRPDCQINADSNRCREDRPPLNTGRFIAWIKDWYHPERIIAGLDMRNPGEL